MVGLEALEDRRLLSGGVTAEIVGGNLVVRGGKLGNNIRVEAVETVSLMHEGHAHGRNIRVVGINTRVNGEFEATFADMGGDLIISLGEGKNTVVVDGVAIADDLIVKAGGGGDAVTLRDSTVEGDLIVGTRGGDDLVAMQAVQVLGEWIINTSTG